MTQLRRLTDWRKRLSDAIEQHRRSPYDEAANNCGLFVADCIAAMTGTDLASDLRGRFATLEQALALLRQRGHADLCAFAASHLAEIQPVFARAGDVMAFRTLPLAPDDARPLAEPPLAPDDARPLAGGPTGWALGIVNGERVTVLRPGGLGTLPRSAAAKAYRVP